MSGYLDNSGREDVLSGGSRMIGIDTPKGPYRVWVKRTGNNPRLRVLLLHGGPGATHEYLEACDSYLPGAGIEYYYYDQLGSGHSDQPDEPSLWDLDRFVDEVEQVRQALGLDRSNFVLYGQSWGGLLAIEYALHHQEHLRAMVISNMMSSVPAYNAYAEQVLMPTMDAGALAEIKALRGQRRHREPPVHGAAERAALRAPRAADAGRGLARPGGARLRPHQPGDLRVHAGAERAGHQRRREPGPLGPHRGAGLDRGTGPGHRRAARHHGPGATWR